MKNYILAPDFTLTAKAFSTGGSNLPPPRNLSQLGS